MTKFGALPLVALAAMASVPAAAQVAISETGELTARDTVNWTGSHTDTYTFGASEGETVEPSLSSTAFDAHLTVRGPDGFRVENDDADAATLDARIMRRLPASGTYTIEVSSYWEGETGGYALTAATRPAVPPQIVVDTTAALTTASQLLDDGKYFELHPFTAQAGQQVTVELTSDTFDTFAVLLTSGGQPLVEDDDGGEGTNSRIQQMLTSDGVYLVGVTSYAPGTTGSYTIVVTLD